jgi:uncharacterized ferredoxin-like protein
MEIMKTVAELMALSAATAPKAKGHDYVETKIISDPDTIERLADIMQKLGEQPGKKPFARDSANVRDSAAIMLVALRSAQPAGLHCGACGYPQCSELPALAEGPELAGPLCAWRLVDLGIALGSAAKTASMHNADNRIMYTVGTAARKLGIMEGEIIVGIPLSAGSKNIYFDRRS